MSDYTVNPKFITKSDAYIVDEIKKVLIEKGSFFGLGQSKEYKVVSITASFFKYKGENKTAQNPEAISFESIMATLPLLKSQSRFNVNSNTLKLKMSRDVYRQRTALFAILVAANIIIVKE